MEKSDSQNPSPAEWKVLYRVVLLETNTFEKAKKISDAEKAILERRHELFRETGADVAGERDAMDDALYALRAWKTALQTRNHAA